MDDTVDSDVIYGALFKLVNSYSGMVSNRASGRFKGQGKVHHGVFLPVTDKATPRENFDHL